MSEFVEIQSNKPKSCGCHETATDIPVLDVRTIPHQIRHATIHGAFDAVAPGSSLIIVAPHKPLPLLAELESRFPITVEYVEEGPTEWKLLITRQ